MPDVINYQKTTFASQVVLNHFLRGTPPAAISKTFVGLLTGDPGEIGNPAGLEPTGGGYTRIEGKFDPPEADADTGQKCVSLADLEFPTATADWGIVTFAAIFDAQTAGHMLYYAPLSATRDVKEGDRMMFDAGNIVVIED